MKKGLTVKELQFLDAIFEGLSHESTATTLAPKIIIQDNGLLLSGDFFIYNGEGCPKIKKLGKIVTPTEFPTVIYSFTQHILAPIITKLGHSDMYAEIPIILENLDAYLKIFLSPEYLALAPKNIDCPPYIYSPTFYNIATPELDFYILDETKKYEVISVIHGAQKLS